MLLDQDIRELLEQAKTIAVVGAKDVPGQPVDMVGRYLLDAGYTVVPVHPVRKTVWGLDAYSSLEDVDVPIDIVDVFRAARFCADHAWECRRLDQAPALFWLQEGIVSEEAGLVLKDTPTAFVQDRCLMVEHRRLVTA